MIRLLYMSIACLCLLLPTRAVAFGPAGLITCLSASVSSDGTSCVSNETVIGNETEESGDGGTLNGAITCWQFTIACGGDIDELGIFIGGLTSSEDITMGVYENETSAVTCTDNDPCPGDKLGDTAAFVGSATNPENIVTALDSAVPLTENETYWICVGDTNGETSYLRANAAGGTGCTGIATGGYTAGTLPATLNSCATPVTTNGAVWGVAQ